MNAALDAFADVLAFVVVLHEVLAVFAVMLLGLLGMTAACNKLVR